MEIKNGLIVYIDENDKNLFIPKKVVGIDYENGLLVGLDFCFESITVEQGNTEFYMLNGCLIWREKQAIIFAVEGAEIPADGSVTKIGACAFAYHKNLKEIEIPACIKKIGYGAFMHTGLEKVVLHEGLEVLDAYAFGFNDNLKELAIPESVKNIILPDFIKDVDAMTERGYKNKEYQVYRNSYAYRWATKNRVPFRLRERTKGPHKCPVCGKTVFSEYNSYEICEVCGWEDETSSERYPEEESIANGCSLYEFMCKYDKQKTEEFEKWKSFIEELADNYIDITDKEVKRLDDELFMIDEKRNADFFQKIYDAWHVMNLHGIHSYLTGKAEQWYIFYFLDMIHQNPINEKVPKTLSKVTFHIDKKFKGQAEVWVYYHFSYEDCEIVYE